VYTLKIKRAAINQALIQHFVVRITAETSLFVADYTLELASVGGFSGYSRSL